MNAIVKTFKELESIAQAAQVVLAVSGSQDLTVLDISDISAPEGPALVDWACEVKAQGRTFVGLVALAGGNVAAHLLEPLEASAIELLAAATVTHVSRRYLQALNHVGLASAPPAIESGAN